MTSQENFRIDLFKIKKSALSLGLAIGLMLLSGCQTLSSLFPEDEKTVTIELPEPQPETVVTHEFELSDGENMVGTLAAIETRENDALPDIARHFGLGYNDISIANSAVSPWTPKPGSRVLLPLQFILPDSPHKGIALNLANMRLFYYPKKQPNKVYTYPVGIGRQGWNTPMGQTSIVAKDANPSWTVPESIHREHAEKGDSLPKVVGAGPDNPLGLYAMRLGIPGYLIHGTNKPYGIGMQISHGCVQLYPEDIEVLFKKATVGMPVRIIHQPYLTAWHQDMLYLEAHEPLPKWAKQKASLRKQVVKKLHEVSAKKGVEVDWEKVERILQHSDGIPTPILMQSPDVAEISANALQLKHPEQFYDQPVIEELKENDWSILVASFNDETKAQQLATMLNHQGPIIPARKVSKDDAYQVIAGPFKSKKEMNAAVKRIKMDFEINSEPLKPRLTSIN
ncbi:MAG: L,D-transpeptidase family protein [Methylobacter sp.]|nr:L,D-transpeptidase family protein [Methylobacter sp.]